MKKSSITKEYLIENYVNSNKTVESMSLELKCNKCTIFRALKRFNIPTRPKKNISKKHLKELYIHNSQTIAEIAKKFNFSETHVNNLIHKNKIKTRKNRYLYSQNNYFFNVPNIQNSYWAGFIAADGCIGNCRGKRFLVINLKNTDRDILEEFKNQTSFTGNISNGKHKGYGKYIDNIYCYSTIQIRNCDQWISDLKQHWNITENKSITILRPNITDINLQLSYIIGLIDGDGHIGIANGKLKFELCGTKDVLEWASNILYSLEDNEKYDKLTVYKKKNEKMHYINCSSIRAYCLLKQLIEKSTPYKLTRKWNKIKEYELNNGFRSSSHCGHE